MSEPIELSVKSQLGAIISDFDKLNKKIREVEGTLKQTGSDVSDSFNKQTKNTENFLGKLRSMGGRVADQLKSDFKSLASLNAITGSLKLSEQFKGSIKETVTLSDAVRKLGTSFGISKDKFREFQSSMAKGLGDLGISSDVAARTMEGLVDTPVRGQKSVLEYSKAAGMLTSISGTQGQEGNVAGGIARVIQAKGGNVNDVDAMKKVAEDMRRVFNVTGKSPAETLKAMEEMFSSMTKEQRTKMSTTGLVNLAATSQVAGPKSTKFIEEFLGMSKIQRAAMEAQGFKDVFTDQGLDMEKFGKASKAILARIGNDSRMAAKTLGLSDEAADGFVRLAESMDKVKLAQEKIKTTTSDLNTQYRESMGLGEAFKANINKVKSLLSAPMAWATQKGTDLLSKTSESSGGAALAVGGAATLAAVLAGYGLKGVGKGLGGMGGLAGGLAKGKAAEMAGVQPVYVVNASEIGGGMGGMGDLIGKGGKMGPALAMLSKAGLWGGAAIAAGGAGYAVGNYAVNPAIEKYTQGTSSEGFEGNIVERLFFKLDKLFGGESSQMFMKNNEMRLKIEEVPKNFKVAKPSRGTTY